MLLHFQAATAKRIVESDYHIIVTGAGGWLGSATLEMLDMALGADFGERVTAIASSDRTIKLRSGRETRLIDFRRALEEPARKPTLMAHYAFLTRDCVVHNTLTEYVQSNRSITSTAVTLAERWKAEGIFIASSGAVYNKNRTIASDIEKNPYGVLKREEEIRFLNFAESNNCKLSLCRLFNLSGPFIHKEFALNSILNSLLDGRDVVLKARHEVLRDFIHVRDLISLGFSMMLDPTQTILEPFDSGTGELIEIGELAKVCAKVIGAKKSNILRESLISDPDIYTGDVSTILRLCQKNGIDISNLKEQIIDTAEYLRNLH
jgi:UDP-glucuronate decarboxylase